MFFIIFQNSFFTGSNRPFFIYKRHNKNYEIVSFCYCAHNENDTKNHNIFFFFWLKKKIQLIWLFSLLLLLFHDFGYFSLFCVWVRFWLLNVTLFVFFSWLWTKNILLYNDTLCTVPCSINYVFTCFIFDGIKSADFLVRSRLRKNKNFYKYVHNKTPTLTIHSRIFIMVGSFIWFPREFFKWWNVATTVRSTTQSSGISTT